MTAPLQSPPPLKHQLLDRASTVIQTVDAHARAVNRKWGTNKLAHLVTIEWAEKFRSQRRKYELAAWECTGSPVPEDADRLAHHGEAMIRAYRKLEEVAVSEGHLPTPPAHWEFELEDGTPVILVRDRAELEQVDPGGRACQIWSLEEIAGIVARFPEISRAKTAFPGAEVIQLRTSKRTREKLDDSLSDLPF